MDAIIERYQGLIYFDPRDEEELGRINRGFNILTPIPDVVGCIDGKVFNLAKPHDASKKSLWRCGCCWMLFFSLILFVIMFGSCVVVGSKGRG